MGGGRRRSGWAAAEEGAADQYRSADRGGADEEGNVVAASEGFGLGSTGKEKRMGASGGDAREGCEA